MRILLVILALTLSVGALFADVSMPEADSRLDKKVALQVDYITLGDAMKRLSEQTGVSIRVGSGERDWNVRERRVTVRAKEIPLKTMLTGVSEMLGYHITQTGKKDQWSYLIWQDAKSRQLEEKLRDAEREEEARRQEKAREDAIASAEDALSESPEEAMKHKQDDPWRAYLGGTQAGRGMARMLAGLGRSIPSPLDLLRNPNAGSIPFSSLSPDLQQAAMDATSGGWDAAMRRAGKKPLDGVTPVAVNLIPIAGTPDTDWQCAGWSGSLTIMGKGPDGEPVRIAAFPLAASDSAAAKLTGERDLALDSGTSMDDVSSRYKSENLQAEALQNSVQRESPTEKNPPTDPELIRTVELGELPKVSVSDKATISRESTGKTLDAISKATGWTAMLESFDGTVPISLFLKPGKQPLYKILIGLEKAGYLWTREKGELRIRPDNWATLRSYAIPEASLKRWRETLHSQGELGIDGIGEIAATLNDSQIDRSLRYDTELFTAANEVKPRGLLRMYGSLSTLQRKSLRSKGGLPFGSLTPAQWDLLNPTIIRAVPAAYILDGRIRLLPEPATLEITLQVDGEERPRVLREAILEK